MNNIYKAITMNNLTSLTKFQPPPSTRPNLRKQLKYYFPLIVLLIMGVLLWGIEGLYDFYALCYPRLYLAI